jgi:hypothetical protein
MLVLLRRFSVWADSFCRPVSKESISPATASHSFNTARRSRFLLLLGCSWNHQIQEYPVPSHNIVSGSDNLTDAPIDSGRSIRLSISNRCVSCFLALSRRYSFFPLNYVRKPVGWYDGPKLMTKNYLSRR